MYDNICMFYSVVFKDVQKFECMCECVCLCVHDADYWQPHADLFHPILAQSS